MSRRDFLKLAGATIAATALASHEAAAAHHETPTTSEKITPSELLTLQAFNSHFNQDTNPNSAYTPERTHQINDAFNEAIKDITNVDRPDHNDNTPAFYFQNRHYNKLIENNPDQSIFIKDPTLEQIRRLVLLTAPEGTDHQQMKELVKTYKALVDDFNHQTVIAPIESGRNPNPSDINIYITSEANNNHNHNTRATIAALHLLSPNTTEHTLSTNIDLEAVEKPDYTSIGAVILSKITPTGQMDPISIIENPKRIANPQNTLHPHHILNLERANGIIAQCNASNQKYINNLTITDSKGIHLFPEINSPQTPT